MLFIKIFLKDSFFAQKTTPYLNARKDNLHVLCAEVTLQWFDEVLK